MAERVFTFCDFCCGDMSVGHLIQNGIGRGWAEWSAEHCVVEFGWERRGEKMVCPECLEDEEVSRCLANRKNFAPDASPETVASAIAEDAAEYRRLLEERGQLRLL